MDARALAFGSVMLASSSLNNLFVTFYLDLFVGVSGLSSAEFYVGQSLYLVWNAVNDPLFGWLQDATSSKRNALRRRARIVAVGGCFWALAFLSVWFPPRGEGVPWFVRVAHFVVSTCAYDGMLTAVELAHSALLSEVTVDDAERARFNAYSAACAGVGSLTSFLGQWYWNKADLSVFRACALLVALLSAVVFVVSASVLSRSSASPPGSSASHAAAAGGGSSAVTVNDPATTATTSTSTTSPSPAASASALGFVRELKDQPNFFVYAGVSSIQSLDCAFEKSSFTIFLAALAGDAVSRSSKATVVSLSFFLPWLVALLVTPLIQRFGVYSVLRGVFVSRLALCGAFAVSALLSLGVLGAGPAAAAGVPSLAGAVGAASAPPALAVGFLLVNRVMSESVCRMSPLVVSDLVDEDRFVHRRGTNETRSASVVGGVNFFGKIFQSVGPMIGFAVFRHRDAVRLDLALVAVPSACVLAQLYLWTQRFSLHGARLKRVKEYVAAETTVAGGERAWV